jgi:hypothetical protein
MRPEDRILCSATRQDFRDEHRETIETLAHRAPVDWEAVASTAERHGVAPIAGFHLRSCDVEWPAAVAERFERAFFENALVKARESERLAEGIHRLRESGYQVMLLKGAALDLLVYTEPWVVASQDSDLLLRPDPDRRLASGERSVRRSLYRGGIEADLQQHHDLDMNGVLPVRYERIWAAARPVSFYGAEAFVMSPEDLLISLCINSCRKRFFRLKSLFDIAESATRLAGLDWTRVAVRAREDRCEAIVLGALLAAGGALEARVPPEALDALGVSSLRAAVLRRLVDRFLERGSLDAPSLLLPYASYRFRQALRSVGFALTYEPPAHHRRTPVRSGA